MTTLPTDRSAPSDEGSAPRTEEAPNVSTFEAVGPTDARQRVKDYTREMLAKEQPAIPYLLYFPSLRRVAREHGYALAIHGSLNRDFDLVAVAWASEASEPEALVDAICRENQLLVAVRDQQDKPHGRRCWTLKGIADVPHGWVDLSVVPPVRALSGKLAPQAAPLSGKLDAPAVSPSSPAAAPDDALPEGYVRVTHVQPAVASRGLWVCPVCGTGCGAAVYYCAGPEEPHEPVWLVDLVATRPAAAPGEEQREAERWRAYFGTVPTGRWGKRDAAEDRLRDALAKAMQEAWDDFVGDTGCYPDCIRKEGRGKLSANFDVGNFSRFVAQSLRAALREEPEAEEVGPEGERPATPEQRAAAARLFDDIQPIEEF